MRTYKVEIAETAIEDIEQLSDFLVSVMSVEGSWRYKETMRQEILSLSLFAGL